MRKNHRSAAVLLLLVACGLGAQVSDGPQLVRDARIALERGRYYEAVETFQLAVRENPNHLDAVVGLAEAYYWLDEYDQAQRYVGEASRLARTNPVVLNLAGKIAIGRGDLPAAEAAFRRVQETEPNNSDASIGLAELALARGQSVEALANLERALRLSPNQRKALLSLVLIYEYLGDQAAAERYLELAGTVHRDRPEVHVLAAEYYLRKGEIERAARSARTAQALDPLNRAATSIRARIALTEGSYLEATAIAETLIAADRNDIQAWYVRSAASHRLGELTDALTSVRTALRIAPDDELLRIWAEWIALEHLGLDHPVRIELAEARAARAADLERAFRYERALKAYRRALQLAPLQLGVRRGYAELFRKMDLRASYVQELEVLAADGAADRRTEQLSELYRGMLSSSVARRWQIDQFTLGRTRSSIAIYLTDMHDERYPLISEALLEFVRRTIQGLDRVEIAHAAAADGYVHAFSSARSHDVDFFIQIVALPTSRFLALDGGVYVARTGSPAAGLSVIRSGPDHAAAAADAFADAVVEALPRRGVIVLREGRRALIDLGVRDGVALGTRFDIVPAAAVTIAPDTPAFIYRPESVVGTFTVTAQDDLVSEGTLDVRGIIDRVGAGDAVIAVPPDSGHGDRVGPQGTDLFPMLYERVRRLR